MYLTTRNLFLCLFLLPLLGIAQSPDREVLIFAPDMDRYRFHRDFTNWEEDAPIRLHFEYDGQVYYPEPIGGFDPEHNNNLLHFIIDSKYRQSEERVWLTVEGKTESFLLPQGDETAFLALNDPELFPYLTEVLSLNEVQKMLKPRVAELDGIIEITEALEGKFPEQIHAYLPFVNWEDAAQKFSAESEPSIDWRKLRFVFKMKTLFSTFAFVELRDRYYPVLVTPYGDHEINWAMDEGSEHLRIMMGREWERDRASGQNFFNRRYPHGLDKQAYEKLVGAFMTDRSNRVDTLIAWSRSIEEMFGHRHGEADELLMHINQIGNYSHHDVYEEVLMERYHQQRRRASRGRDNAGEMLLLGMFLSLIVFLIGAFMRYRGSKWITLQRLTALEMTTHAFIWCTMGAYVLIGHRAGAMVVESPAVWILYMTPIATFYLNILYLIPNFLMKRRWIVYLLSVAGIVGGFFLVGFTFFSGPLEGMNLVNIGDDWFWLFSEDGFSGHDVDDAIIGLQMGLIPIALVYGLARHLLLNRLPILQRQKEALNAELHTLKHQISPHFFFNSLNTVYSFALSEDSPQTAEAITRLSDLMRFAIYHGDQDKIALNTELEYLADYIELQRLRLNPVKHDLQYHVTGDPAQLKIAPLLLITLIENAFKHGISMSHNSYINIDLFIQENGLILSVENSVHPEQQFEGVPVATKAEVVGGVGLVNTQQRLDLLYKGRYDWQIDAQADHYFTRLCLDLD
ncbi:MAG: histidine kinase [Bacteroidota bacterium]